MKVNNPDFSKDIKLIKSFGVIEYDINGKQFIIRDIIPYLEGKYKDLPSSKKPKTWDEFREFIKKESMYQFWARCEYEIVLQSWPTGNVEKKIDVYDQIMANLDLVTLALYNAINLKNSPIV